MGSLIGKGFGSAAFKKLIKGLMTRRSKSFARKLSIQLNLEMKFYTI